MTREGAPPKRLLSDLLRLARALGLTVRREPFESRTHLSGGRCRVQGRDLLILDSSAPAADQATALGEALLREPWYAVAISPGARELLERLSRRRGAAVEALGPRLRGARHLRLVPRGSDDAPVPADPPDDGPEGDPE